jgi:hypothetical protein
VTYELEAAIPRVAVLRIGSGPTVQLGARGPEPVPVGVRATITGTRQLVSVQRDDAIPVTIPAVMPTWARELVVDVTLPVEHWQQFSDFGVTLFDAKGAIVTDAPLNYAHGRIRVPLGGDLYPGPFALELFPAFADTTGPYAWSAEVALSYLRSDPVPLALLGMESESTVTVQPGRTANFQLTPVPAELDLPKGHHLLIAVEAFPQGGPAAVRLGVLAH